jgi:hypothetical protein
MKTSLLGCIGSVALALSALAQNPTPALEASPPNPPPAPAAVTTPAVPTAAIESDSEEDLERSIERKVRRGLNGINITFGDEKDKARAERRARREAGSDDRIDENVERAIEDRIERKIERGMEDGALMAIPIVGIIFATLFGAPVAIVGVIMFFSYIKARSLHKTVRMMVEKGQPVPEALFAAPHTPAKQRSDMRRGVTLLMVGLGIMLFLAAVNEFEGGAWALGLIPFMIGAGYLAIWVMEGNKITFNRTANDNAGTDTPPPLP